MKKILSITLVSAVALILSTGCSSKQDGASPEAAQNQEKGASTKHVSADIEIKGVNLKVVCKSVSKAAKKTDWRITKFKRSILLAEKIVGDKSASVTIEFGHGHINFIENTSTLGSDYDKYLNELKSAISEELKEANSSHH